MLFYSIELLHIHNTCLHVYYCLHIPSSLAQDARLCHGRGKDSRKLWRYPNSSSRLGFHGFGVAHDKGGLEVALPPNASVLLNLSMCGSCFARCFSPVCHWILSILFNIQTCYKRLGLLFAQKHDLLHSCLTPNWNTAASSRNKPIVFPFVFMDEAFFIIGVTPTWNLLRLASIGYNADVPWCLCDRYIE